MEEKSRREKVLETIDALLDKMSGDVNSYDASMYAQAVNNLSDALFNIENP